jgi:hypothetical protein
MTQHQDDAEVLAALMGEMGRVEPEMTNHVRLLPLVEMRSNAAFRPPVEVEAPPRREPPVDPEIWLRRRASAPSLWRRLLVALGLRANPSSTDRTVAAPDAKGQRIFGSARRRVAIKAAAKQQSRVFGKRRT